MGIYLEHRYVPWDEADFDQSISSPFMILYHDASIKALKLSAYRKIFPLMTKIVIRSCWYKSTHPLFDVNNFYNLILG